MKEDVFGYAGGAMQIETDEELFALFKANGDEAAFAVLMTRYARMVYGICQGILGHAQDAQDACQGVFVVFARKAKMLRRGVNLAGWLYGVAKYVALTSLRSRVNRMRREDEAASREQTAGGGDSQPATESALIEAVYREMAALSGKEQQAIVLRYLEGQSEMEVAEIAQCPVGTVSWRASHGIDKLRKRLARQGFALGATALVGLLEAEAQAAIPETLVPSILAAVKSVAAGGAATGAVSTNVMMLAKGAMKMMFWNQVKLAAAVICAGAVVAGAGGTAAVKLFSAAAVPAAEEAPGKVKLLCSFEKEELERKTPKPKSGEPLFKVAEDGSLKLSLPSDYGARTYTIVKEHATDGEYALIFPYDWGKGPHDTGEMMIQKRQIFRALDRTYQDRYFGTNWSGYDHLWIDVVSPEGPAWVRVIAEDEEDGTPYARYAVPKGESATLQFPLAAFADQKRKTWIDPARMANITLYLEDVDGQKGALYLDNFRLAAKDAPKPKNFLEPTEVIERDWGWSELAKKLPPITHPKKLERVSGKVTKLGPVTLPLPSKEHFDSEDFPFAGPAIGAFDNQHLLALFRGNRGAWALASYDGGKTWGGTDGAGSQPTFYGSVPMNCMVDGLTGDGFIVEDFFAVPGDVRAPRLSLPAASFRDRFREAWYCYGGRTIRPVGLRVLSFQGDRWKTDQHGLIDDYVRHCTGYQPILRLPPGKEAPDGRLWTFGRIDCHPVGSRGVNALYSDDNGLTWTKAERRRWITPQNKNVTGYHPMPYGEHVGCVYSHYYGAEWTYFDGKEWVKPVWVAKGEGTGVFSAAALGPNRPYVLLGAKGMLQLARLENGEWKTEVLDETPKDNVHKILGAALTVSGPDLYVVWARCHEQGEDAAGRKVWSSILLLRRYDGKAGKLGPVQEVATDPEPVAYLSVPLVSPPDFISILLKNSFYCRYDRYGYSGANGEYGKAMKELPGRYELWIKFLRVPTGDGDGGK